MRLYKIVFLFCLLATYFAVPAYGQSPGCRLDRDNSITIDQCVDQIHNSYDVEINEIYQKILEELRKILKKEPHLAQVRKQIIASQRSWISFRDNDCKAFKLYYSKHNQNDLENSVCLMQRTEQRIKELKQWQDLLENHTK